MTREEVIGILREELPQLTSEYGVKRIGLFGSYAKGKPADDSDVDILVEFDKPMGLKFVEFAEYLERLLGRFSEGYDCFLDEGFTSIKDRFVDKSTFLGEKISIVSFESHFIGIAKDIGNDGSLCLQLDDGEQMSFNAGEIVCCSVD